MNEKSSGDCRLCVEHVFWASILLSVAACVTSMALHSHAEWLRLLTLFGLTCDILRIRNISSQFFSDSSGRVEANV